jgi:hypothetical protein
MLRGLVLILALANAGWLGWSLGWLDGLVGGSKGDREPQRLSNQVRPEIVRILPPSAASGAAGDTSAPSGSRASGSPVPRGGLGQTTGPSGVAGSDALASSGGGNVAAAQDATASPPGLGNGSNTATACIEAGPFTAFQLVTAQSSLRAGSVAPVAEVATERPGMWMVYMGRYASQEAMLRKIEELKRRRLDFEEVRGLPEFEPGLSLGRFGSRSAAEAALAQAGQRAVRTARVVSVAPATLHWLRQADATPARQQELLSLKAPALGEGFAACGTSPAAQAARQWAPPGASGAASGASGATGTPSAMLGAP